MRRLPGLPGLLAAAAIAQLCAQLCPALRSGTGSGTGSAPLAAAAAALPGEPPPAPTPQAEPPPAPRAPSGPRAGGEGPRPPETPGTGELRAPPGTAPGPAPASPSGPAPGVTVPGGHGGAGTRPSGRLGATPSRQGPRSPASPRASPAPGRAAEGLSPAAGAPPAGLTPRHRGDAPAATPQSLGGTPLRAGDAEPGATTAPLSWHPRSLVPPATPGHPWQRLSLPAASLPLDTAGGGTDTITAATAATMATATTSTTTTAAATTDTAGTATATTVAATTCAAATAATTVAATTTISAAATAATSAAATTATSIAATATTTVAATTTISAAATAATSAAATTATAAAATAAISASATAATTVGATTVGATTAGATTAGATSATAATATITAATTTPARLGDTRAVMLEPGAAVSQGAAAGLTRGPPTHLPTTVSGSLGQPSGPLGDPGSLLAAEDTTPGEPPSSPTGWVDADTPSVTAAGRAPQVFIAEDQPPLLRASVLRIPCELVLDMVFTPALQDPASHAHQELVRSFNRTVAPLFAAVPGFLRLEVTEIREGGVVLAYDALFSARRAQALGLGTLLDAVLGSVGHRAGLAVGAAPVLHHVLPERPLDPCSSLFTCRAGFTCVAGEAGNSTCTSLCHRDYCKNQGICTHAPERTPICRCPVGSDFWFVGLRCDYRVTRQSLLGTAAGVLLSIVLLGAVAATVAVRRFKALLLEARAEQTRSSYRRFCRLDDVSAQYWSRSRLPSASSLDNPAFSNSEELLHLQILDNGCCGCREDSGITGSSKHGPVPPARRPSFRYEWETSSSSVNDPMVDSGKASDISVSSWPMEPMQWVPFPLLHQLSRQRPHRARRPRSYCEGMELGSLERSWTA